MPVSDNANGVITVGQHSGGYTAQLGFSSNSNIYWRDNPSTTTGAWKKVHDSSNFGKTEIDALNVDADTLDGREANEFIKVYDGQLINTDLDTLSASDTGVYHSNSQYGTNTNIPHNNYFTLLNLRNPYGGSVDSTGNSNDRAAQIFYGDTRGQAYWRPYQGSTTGWHPWEKIYTSYSLTKSVIDALNIDANTLDGYDNAAFGKLSNTQNWTGTNTFSGNVNVAGALDVNSSSGISSTGWVHLQRYATNSNVAIGNNGSNVDLLVPNGDVLVTSDNPYPLVISKSVNGGGAGIKFTDQSESTQHGFIDYFHQDGSSYGSSNAFVYRGDQPSMSHVFDVGTNKDGMQVKVNGAAQDVHHDGNFGKLEIDALNVHAASATTATHATQASEAFNADNAANSANSLKLGNVAASGYMLKQTQGVYTAIQSGDWKVPALGQGTFAKSGSVGKPSGAGHGYWFNLGRRDGSAGGYAGIWVNNYNTAGSGAWLGRNDSGGDPTWEKIFTDKTLAKTDIDALNVHAASATTATNAAKLGNVAASDYQLKDDTAQFSYVAAPTDNWEEAAELKTLSDGTWIMEIFTNTSALGFYSCRWSATVAISSANSTNDDWNSEIPLHMSGHANSSNRGVYARTTMNLGATGKHLTLDIKVTNSSSTTATYIIKFRKLI
jgi:hypothetical protein